MSSGKKNPSDYCDLSIVLQGPVELDGCPTAALAASTARRVFPGAEVIVSCWQGDQTATVRSLVDHLATSPDPGPQRHSAGVLNVNRQIVSSHAGLKLATRPYVLKARSDLVFRDARLWTEYLKYQTVFGMTHGHDPILITNLTTVNPRYLQRYFALCDWIYLGPRDAMAELLAAPLFPNEYLAYDVSGMPVLRYNAEQWIAVNYLARYGLNLDEMRDGYVTEPTVAQAHRELVGKHFVMSSWFRLGLGTQKHRISSFSLDRMYTQREWEGEFLGRRSLIDPERIAIQSAYHPFTRRMAKQFKRLRSA